ncbi:MAG: DUF6247 family protein [Sporichthyaceae bacterium]
MATSPVPDEYALPALPREGASPAEIRAALHAEYRDEFDRDYRAALDEAGRSLDLSDVLEVVESWRRRCWATRDRQAWRHAMRRAAELLTGEVPPEDEPLAVTEQRVHSHR